MRLNDFLSYEKITVQCHDNPDADAIASGFGLYCYFASKGKDVSLVYSGRGPITKSNLVLMLEKLSIPIVYVKADPKEPLRVDGLLITVDCQYGAGNVKGLAADNVAIIDHHQVEIENVADSVILPGIGSCSTVVFNMLKDEGFDVNEEPNLPTALYYGLFTDTNQLSEVRHPYDLDMWEELSFDSSLITLFKNSNISLQEMDIASSAMASYAMNEEHHYAIVKSEPCDPNILGLISDFFLQVDVVKTCIVYADLGDGYKISVRSCVREVNASELAAFVAKDIGSGGGHIQKAGGYISKSLFEKKYPGTAADDYFFDRMKEYYEAYELYYAGEYDFKPSQDELYIKKNLPVGYVRATDMVPVGHPITIRTLEGDVDMKVTDDLIIIIGIKGEVYPNREEKFLRTYEATDRPYTPDECAVTTDYTPQIKDRETGKKLLLTQAAKVCIPSGRTMIYARKLDSAVKVFTSWDNEKYMLGKPGDYLASRTDDPNDIYVIDADIFRRSYEKK